MWWAGKQKISTVYFGQDEVRLAYGDTQEVVSRGAPLAEAVAALEQALDSLAQVVRPRVLVSAGWSPPFLLPPVEGVANDGEWKQIAAGMVSELTGIPMGGRLWLNPQTGEPPLAVVLHPELDMALKPILKKHRPQTLRPWWAEVLDSHLKTATAADPTASNPPPPNRGIAVIDSDAVTLLVAKGDCYVGAQSYGLAAGTTHQVLARALISHGVDASEVAVFRMAEASSKVSNHEGRTTAFLETME